MRNSSSHYYPPHNHPHHSSPSSYAAQQNRFRGSPLTPSPNQFYTPPPQQQQLRQQPRSARPQQQRSLKRYTPPKSKAGWQHTVDAIQRWGRTAKQQVVQGKVGVKYRSTNKPKYELTDQVRLISIESSEGNWDSPPALPDQLAPPRTLPNRVRDADDFNVTLRDVLPWLANLFQSCGCGFPRKDRRVINRSHAVSQTAGPRLETVCLDCGNVLEKHLLPPDLLQHDAHSSYNFARMVDCAGNFPSLDNRPVTFEGYQNWTISARAAKQRQQKFVPLPNFENGPSRCFQNNPREVRPPGQPRDYVIVDETGVVALPELAGGSDDGH